MYLFGKEGTLVQERIGLKGLLGLLIVMLPMSGCGEKTTETTPAEVSAEQSVSNRSLTDLGGGQGDEAQLVVPLESLDLESTPIDGRSRERRSPKEVEACVDEKSRNFTAADGEPTVPSMDELRAIIVACGA